MPKDDFFSDNEDVLPVEEPFSVVKGGRCLFRLEYLEQAEKLVQIFGATEEQLALFFDVAVTTVKNWRSKYPGFDEVLEKAEDGRDGLVEHSLYRNCVGYEYTEEKVTKDGEVIEVTRSVPANGALALKWLERRKPKEWERKPQLIEGGSVNAGLPNINIMINNIEAKDDDEGPLTIDMEDEDDI